MQRTLERTDCSLWIHPGLIVKTMKRISRSLIKLLPCWKLSTSKFSITNPFSYLFVHSDAAATRKAGIIYLHSIDSTRPNKPDIKQQELFQRFTDHNDRPFLVFGITMWNAGLHKEEDIQSKEDAFKEKIWGDMIQAGAEIVQIHNGQSRSAWDPVEKIYKAIKYVDFGLSFNRPARWTVMLSSRKEAEAPVILFALHRELCCPLCTDTFIQVAGANRKRKKHCECSEQVYSVKWPALYLPVHLRRRRRSAGTKAKNRMRARSMHEAHRRIPARRPG